MKVRIFKPHTHADVRHTPGPDGVEINVSAQDKAFLDRAGITTRPPATYVGTPAIVAAADSALIDSKPAKR